jgi:CRISPR-associated protein Cas1
VYQLFSSGTIESEEITREQKARLLGIATCDVLIDGKKSPLMVALSRTTNSLFECFEGSRRKIVYPEFCT